MERIGLLGETARATGVPVVATFLGDAVPAADRAALRRQGVLCARDPAEAVRFLAWLYRAREAAGQRPADRPAATAAVARPVSWPETAAWIEAAGIALPPWRLLDGCAPTAQACAGLSFPVAVKALPKDADHKTELGLVVRFTKATT